MQHPTVHPLIAEYDLGSSESEAKHSLILDREERKLYVASMKDAQKFLAEQWPKSEPIHMTQEEYLARVTEALKNVPLNEADMEEIHKRIEEQSALVEALQHWLNQYLPN